MLKHLAAGLIAIAFTRLVDRTSQPLSRKPRLAGLLAITVLVLGALPLNAHAAESLTEGTTVRIRSKSIEAGWHTGRIKRDSRSCSMIQLDRPTGHGYTQLTLTVVNALQLGRTGAWTAINAKQALASEPAHCLAEGTA